MKYRKYPIKENFFQKWTPEMAYILGFISADGSVNQSSLSIELQKRDNEVLEFIKNKLSPQSKIKITIKKGKEYVKLRINSVLMIKDLSDLGITPKKSHVIEIKFDVPDEFLGDYIRGVFDGDGYVKTRRNTIESEIYSASLAFLKQLQSKLENRGYIRKRSKCYSLSFSKKDSLWLADLMYQTNRFALKRKKELFQNYEYIRNSKYWTEEQIQMLISEFPKNGAKPLVKKLNKTYKAIHKQVWDLKRKNLWPQ